MERDQKGFRKKLTLYRRAVTLIEMMIVMFLIALILGVVGYNYQGTLHEGKVFKTRTTIEKLKMALTLSMANSNDDDLTKKWRDLAKQSTLMGSGNDLTRDGWGEEFEVKRTENGDVEIRSRKLDEYLRANPKSLFKK